MQNMNNSDSGFYETESEDPASESQTDTESASLSPNSNTSNLSVSDIGKLWLDAARAGTVVPPQESFPSSATEQRLAEWQPKLYFLREDQQLSSYSGWRFTSPFDSEETKPLYTAFQYPGDEKCLPDGLPRSLEELAKEYEVPGDDENFTQLGKQQGMVDYSLTMSNDTLYDLAHEFEWQGVAGEAARDNARRDFYTGGSVTLPGATCGAAYDDCCALCHG